MLRDIIIENCRRLISFFNDNDKYADYWLVKEVSYPGLLKAYANILDMYGAPNSFMSRLFIPADHYDGFVGYAEKLNNFKVLDWPDIVAVSFDYDGYHWVVQKKIT